MSLIPTEHYGSKFKDLKKCYIDFEYNRTTEARLNLVCASLHTEDTDLDFWLHKNECRKILLKKFLLDRRESHIFLAWNVTAEAASFMSLGLDPTKFAWIDLQLEYKMLINHWNKYRYGKQLLKGEKKFTHPPAHKRYVSEEEKKKISSEKPETNLAAGAYKLLGVEIDTEHKKAMRDLIISDPKSFTDEEKDAILSYCAGDVKDLPAIYTAIIKAYKSSTAKRAIYVSEIAYRGKTAARTAMIQQIGYPVHPEKVTKFSRSVNNILSEIAVDVNRQFPLEKVFVFKKKENRYSMTRAPQKNWIQTCEHADNWMRTTKGELSLSLDAYSKFYSYRHDFPERVFPAQMLRYLKTKQALNGFIKSPKNKSFFDYYGPDGRARPWLNPYGSQSARYQPGATGYIPLKSAWMRSLITPPKGSSIVGIDYGSEEFLLSALISKDEAMYESYKSGDAYFDFAKRAKAVPKDAKREDHESVRTAFKSSVLGISYLMAAPSLAIKMTNDTGVYHTEEQAQDFIDKFYEAYPKYAAWQERTMYEYRKRGYLKLPDGWIMFGDNPNFRSVTNCPVQGMGSVVLRKAIELCQLRGLKVILPLHDALYVEYKNEVSDTPDILYDLMQDAFSYFFQNDKLVYEWSKCIRQDIDVWGPGLEEGYFNTPAGRPYKQQEIYVDPRGRKEYERFEKYLT